MTRFQFRDRLAQLAPFTRRSKSAATAQPTPAEATPDTTKAPKTPAEPHCEQCHKLLEWRDAGKTLCRNCRTRAKERHCKGVRFIPAKAWEAERTKRAVEAQTMPKHLKKNRRPRLAQEAA